jgi:ammonia channel protein AmtB
MFCAATASIVSGALAERIKLWPFLVFTVLLTGFIYPLQASWKWGGGFLDAMGFLDFAGSTVVHSVGGWAALAGTIAVVFTNSDASLSTQLYSIIVVGLFTFIASGVLWYVIKSVSGIRVSEEDEITGLDISELGMPAYDIVK